MRRDNEKAERYDYTKAGFNSFLTRSIESDTAPSLGASLVTTRRIEFDRQAVGSQLGDTYRIGLIQVNGRDGNIIVPDADGTPRILIGEEEGGL